MKKNLYYREVFRRENVLKRRILDFFLAIASYPRMLIEVFIRKNFGERYFSWATAITIILLLMIYPILITSIYSFATHPFGSAPSASPFPGGGGIFGGLPSQSNPYAANSYGQTQPEISNPYLEYLTWYIFTAGFIVFSYSRYQEIKRNPSVFDFARFSLYTGDVNSFFRSFSFMKGKNIRTIEVLYEPLPFFLLGCILWIAGQSVGGLLVFSSICYGLSYLGAYERGDNFVMDKIDEMILNEEMEAAFIHDEPADKTRGVRFYARKPPSEFLRRKVEELMIEDEDDDFSTAS